VVADDHKFGFLPPYHGQRLPTFGVGTQKAGNAAVESPLYLRGEVARRQFVYGPVVAETFTANTLALARFIGAGALRQVYGLVGTFLHLSSLLAFHPVIDSLVVKK
jgi:hypothetical protein